MPPSSQKSTIIFRRKTGPQCRYDLLPRKNPIEVTAQLLIFLSRGTIGAIYVLHRWFEYQEVDLLVGHP